VHGIASTNNDDSCDIALLPAATLLLPYFEVDLDDQYGETTLFTVTNVSPRDQIARVTLWTDYAFPAITFNIYLTGYDVQSINLFDVIRRGTIAPDAGTGTQVTSRGAWSNRNRRIDLASCAQLPGRLPEAYIIRMQSAFTEGAVPDFGTLAGCNNVGTEHDNAVGYATIDLVRNCSTNNPFSEEYWTEDLAHDNVLIGDYQQVHSTNNFAQGSPMVHIRAVPEGGTLAERLEQPYNYNARFARTFYARYQPAHAPQLDGRQPLPSVFAARWIMGGAPGFKTELKIWREGSRGREATCATHDDNVLAVAEIVRFDERENAVGERSRGYVRTGVGTNMPYAQTSKMRLSTRNSRTGPLPAGCTSVSTTTRRAPSAPLNTSNRGRVRTGSSPRCRPKNVFPWTWTPRRSATDARHRRRSAKRAPAPRSSDQDHEESHEDPASCARTDDRVDRVRRDDEQRRQLRHRGHAGCNVAASLLRSRS
jgi:hypothetical protein